MTENKKIFFSISLLSLYIYFKDKYKNYNTDSVNLDEDFQIITKKLSAIDKYQHLTNKHEIVKKAYSEFLNCNKETIIDEDKMFDIVSVNIEGLDEKDRKYVLNSVIFIANRDKKISEEEKELIIQIAYLLNLKTDFKQIMQDFNKSEFSEPISTLKITMIMVSILVLILGICLYFYKEQTNKVNIFKGDRLVFSEISFNRYVIYKNSYINDTEHFRKQAIFYFNGDAEIGINPKNIKYDLITKNVTILYKDNPFIVNPSFDGVLLVDKINPEEITENEAKIIAGGVAIVAGYAGVKAGGVIGGIAGTVMPKFKLIAPTVGTVAGGLAGTTGAYFLTKNILDGMKISSNISKEEEEKVKNSGRKLITEILNNDKKLIEFYMNDLKDYLKNKYASVGVEVNDIEYKEVK